MKADDPHAVRLNLGCGDDRLEGWVNIDYRPDVATIVADCSTLPVRSGTAAEIRALDLLEHFPHDRTQRILAEWRRALTPAGTLTVKVPNIAALAHAIVRSPHRQDVYVRNIYGGHRWGPDGMWDAHHWAWSPETICAELAQAGYQILACDNDLNMTVTARLA